jgi:molecular chaperone DnaK (HSP70)
MELIDVVSNYLRIVGNISYQEICNWAGQKSQPRPSKDDINWVITVPAIWTDQARIFMREAAFKAGLVSDGTFSKNIGICLEPEGAALYCFGFAFKDLLAATRKRQSDLKLEVTGLKNEIFMVIDLGGGTTDITYHKIRDFNETYETCDFEELRPPSGGPWGGRLINQELDNKLMAPLLGDQFDTYNKLKDIKAKFLAREFKGKKSFDGTKEIYINLNILKMEAEIDIPDLCNKCSFDPELIKIVSGRGKSLVTLTPTFVKQLFAIVLDPLKNHLSEIIPSLSETPNFAILVGGMGANKYVKSELESFLEKLVPGSPIKLIQPSDAGLAIVQGAIRFAYNPTVFGVRKARTNYGLATCKADEPNKLLFSRIIEKGTPLDRSKTLGPYLPSNDKQTVVVVSIYESDSDTVKYVDDPECILVAQINVDVNMSLPFKNRGFKIELLLEGTVISGVVRPMDGQGEVTVLRWTSC